MNNQELPNNTKLRKNDTRKRLYKKQERERAPSLYVGAHRNWGFFGRVMDSGVSVADGDPHFKPRLCSMRLHFCDFKGIVMLADLSTLELPVDSRPPRVMKLSVLSPRPLEMGRRSPA